jgi:thiamine-phosphate pyrophosphorylase
MIDANLNRLREGIRTAEDICRYIYNDAKLAKELKAMRHLVRTSLFEASLMARDVDKDVLRPTTKTESSRSDIKHIMIANLKRSQESARSLEETLKIFNAQDAENFKSIRYRLYATEQEIFARLFCDKNTKKSG